MPNLHRSYESATGDGGGATPGARALMSWFLGAYSQGAANLGIYNPKRLGSGWSLHAEGRACDLGTAPYGNPPGGGWPAWGLDLAEALRTNSQALGVQCIIFRRRIWSGSHPDAGWRSYTGSNPHDGHLHVELSRAAASSLTVAEIDAVLAGGVDAPVDPPPPTPAPPSTWYEEMIMSLPTLRRDATGAAVRVLQGMLLGARQDIGRFGPRNTGVDGHFGQATEAAVRRVQAADPDHGPADGIVGPITYRRLHRG